MAMQDDGAALKDCETDSRPEFSACAARPMENFPEIRPSFEAHLTLGLRDTFLRGALEEEDVDWNEETLFTR